ncbi:hypothetical protein [Halorubellus sp. PRR65]|uniref:DUF7344 domain-containing protein n=1 Tax=Halorubellus sp. PRR65 TaxID=3098148 RepID=UPI002B2612BA|nr:hypothetical protein [Halorubellus sp. PRR65]
MTLDQDAIFHTLSNERRRSVIQVLRARDAATVRDLTGAVAGIEYGVDADRLDHRQRKRVYTSLVQTHLPSMASYGLVEYDKDRGVVTPEASLDTFDPYLDAEASAARSNARTLRSLTGAFAVLTALLAVDAPLIGGIPAFAVALTGTLGIGALAAGTALSARSTLAESRTGGPEASREK